MTKETETEKALLEDIQRSGRPALQRFYNRYLGYAMAVALRYVPQRDEAQDVVQDAFIKALSAVGKFVYHGEGSLKGWMMSIVAHTAINHIRQRSRIVFTDQLPDESDTSAPPVERVPPDVLTRLIGELPDGYRVVLNLFVFGQLPHREIARQLGISESTSASQYLRAKKLLGRKINEYLKRKENE